MSFDFNFAEPTASHNASADDNMNTYPADIGSIKKSDIVVLHGRPAKVVEVTHASPGKHGHSKAHLVGIDIFSGRRYEHVAPVGHMIQVPNVSKKDYLLVNIDGEGYATLLNEDTCNVRSDLKLNQDTDIAHRIRDKFDNGNGQVKVTVLKALNEEQIIGFKMTD